MTKYTQQKPTSIQDMFGSIAQNYDKTNQVISFRFNQRWNKLLIEAVKLEHQPKVLLDLCAGTGEVAYGWLRNQSEPSKAILLDFCQEMLDIAKSKAQKIDLGKHQVDYIQADAQQIPLPDECVDCVTIAYGIRNVKEPRLCSHEVLRVLRPGGKFAILELTQPQNSFLRMAHGFYMQKVMPFLGGLLTANGEAYRYLCNSVQGFVKPKELEQVLRHAGFKQITSRPLMGGIATLFVAEKP